MTWLITALALVGVVGMEKQKRRLTDMATEPTMTIKDLARQIIAVNGKQDMPVVPGWTALVETAREILHRSAPDRDVEAEVRRLRGAETRRLRELVLEVDQQGGS